MAEKSGLELRREDWKQALEDTTIPQWIVTGIRKIAHNQGHGFGENEVICLSLDFLSIFETLQPKKEKEHERTEKDRN